MVMSKIVDSDVMMVMSMEVDGGGYDGDEHGGGCHSDYKHGFGVIGHDGNEHGGGGIGHYGDEHSVGDGHHSFDHGGGGHDGDEHVAGGLMVMSTVVNGDGHYGDEQGDRWLWSRW
ncbi:uncharacterized protein LOC128226040 [Mya arenaria]|uniref:uncharacterized protein LOC128226040 n=1 Tax=Mya arenaria TaxID=6604 RepID=UPI0022E1D1C8|nr:uncharacterized protein LOC128226040 [Mya arenaria]